MPDFERLIDGLREHAARTPEARAHARGLREGKTLARLQVAALAVVALVLTLASQLAHAHGGHGAPLLHLHAGEIVALALILTASGAVGCWFAARRSAS